MSRLTRDGTAKPISRHQILRHARGQRNINFSVQLTTSSIGNLTRLIHTLLYAMTIHKYIPHPSLAPHVPVNTAIPRETIGVENTVHYVLRGGRVGSRFRRKNIRCPSPQNVCACNNDSSSTSFVSATNLSHTAANIPGKYVYTFVASNDGRKHKLCAAKRGNGVPARSRRIFIMHGLLPWILFLILSHRNDTSFCVEAVWDNVCEGQMCGFP